MQILDQIMHSTRRPSGGFVVEPLAREIRQACRRLWHAPGFSIAVVLSLLICIGPNVAIVSALYALVLKPLPFPNAAQLVTIVNVGEKSGGQIVASSMPQYLDFKAHADRFAGFGVVAHGSVNINEETEPLRVAVDYVGGDYFGVLGVTPVLGRFFNSADEVVGKNRVVVLAARFWRVRYHADPAILGRKLLIGGQPCEVVGVAPDCLAALYAPTEIFQPHVPLASQLDPQARYRGNLTLIGRLKPGILRRAGATQLQVIEENFRTAVATPAVRTFMANAGFRLAVRPLRPGGAVEGDASWWLLQAGAVLVLLIGAVNVTNLFLARVNARRAELAIRIALGAGQGVVFGHVLAESVVLTTGSAAAGIGVGYAALQLFNAFLPLVVPGAAPIAPDVAVVGLVLVASFLLALLIAAAAVGLTGAARLRLTEARTATSGRIARAASGVFVVGQVAFAVVLLIGATLLIRSFANAVMNDPGFDAEHVVQARITLPAGYAPTRLLEQRYQDPRAAANVAVQRRIMEAMQTIPGVQAVAESLDSVIAPNLRPVPFSVRGDDGGFGSAESQPLVHINAVSPEFFSALGMRLLSGRGFTEGDDFSKAPVAIVDETFVRRYFPEKTVEGHEIYLSRGLPIAVDGWPRIVGVVSRASFTGLDSHDDLPIVFVPLVGFPATSFSLLVQSRRATGDLLHEMRGRLREIDPGIPLLSAGTLEERLDQLLMPRRGLTWLLVAFAGLALLLSTVGLYGVLAYDVSQRTREIGIRGAIGASRSDIMGMILRSGMRKTFLGLALGLGGAFVVTRFLTTMLFGVGALDAISYSAVVGLLAAVAALACWLPARRAAKVDPLIALRAE